MDILGIFYMVLAIVLGAACGFGVVYFFKDRAPVWLTVLLVISVVVFWAMLGGVFGSPVVGHAAGLKKTSKAALQEIYVDNYCRCGDANAD